MDELIKRLRLFRDERDWAQFHTPKDLAISVTIEAAELLELFQWRRTEDPASEEFIAALRSEAADILLYLLLLSDTVGFNLAVAAAEKLSLNELRFPIETSRGVSKPIDRSEKPK